MSFNTKDAVEQLIADADPHDGLRVREVIVGDEHSLHLAFYRGGVPVPPPWQIGDGPQTVEVWKLSNPSPAQIGEKRRLLMLLEAVCRYFNTCGDWNQLELALGEFGRFLHTDLRLAMCGTFDLIDTCVTTEGTYEHVFVRDNCPWAIRWSDEEFFDVVSLSEIGWELREQERNEPHVIGGSGFGDEGRGRTIPRLPDHGGLETDARGTGEDVPGRDPEG